MTMETPFQPGRVAVPTTQVEIAISCRNLPDMDVLSKSDPMCVAYVKQFASEHWREIGRTEVIKNTLNPDFVRKFVMDYFFEEQQKLKFEVYDIDCDSPDLSKHDFLGSMQCSLGEVVSSVQLQRPLQSPHHRGGMAILSVEEVSACKDEITLQFGASKLDKKDFFGKSDPFLVFSRVNENRSFTVVHKTEVVKCNLSPTWNQFTLPVRTLCNGDVDRVIQVDCYDWNQSGSHELIGSFSTTVKELSKGPGTYNEYPCIDSKKQAKNRKYVNSGVVKLLSCKLEKMYTFMDYIKGGTQVHCTIAVDFTASNGDPRSAQSLHFLDPYQPNLYARALRAVGEIIQDYDSDKLFPALGFGAKLPPQGVVSHEFFLNGHASNPYCKGIDGVIDAYYQTLQVIQLYGPTNFSPVINHIARIASQGGAPGSNYFILLILTDGIITDMQQTCEAIVNASSLPLSIIIVGIGDADFDAMKVLDGDDVRLSARGRYAERDIVQFVPFREFIGGSFGNDLNRSQVMLAKEVLAEIPDQVMSYMKKYGVKPNPPHYEDIARGH